MSRRQIGEREAPGDATRWTGGAAVALFVIVAALLVSLLGGCAALAGGTFSRQTADEVVGVAATPESRQCRLELAVTFAIVIMTDNTLDGGSPADAGALGTKAAGLLVALQRARSAAPELREVQIARTLTELAQLTESRVKRLVGALVVSGGIPSEDQIVAFVRSSAIADAAIGAMKIAVLAIEMGARTLEQCQGVVDAELATQVARLEAAARPR